jgi:colanic acid biosynthesis glycosyl transferase WcaI
MKILYICQYFPPEMGAPAARVSELGKIWASGGHEVTVVTGFPNYPTGVVPKEYRAKKRRFFAREDFHGVRVQRAWLAAYPNSKPWQRILNYCSFTLSAALRALFLPRPEVIIGTSPQLAQALAALFVGKVRRIPFIFEVRDLWPESLTWGGDTRLNSVMYSAMARISKLLYSHADHIVIVSPSFSERLTNDWSVPSEKISLVMNGVDADNFSPAVDARPAVTQFGLHNRFVVTYTGIIGNAHGLTTIVRAAELLKDHYPDVLFLIVGEGADKSVVQAEIERSGLSNVLLLGEQPRQLMPALICASDACIVLLRRSDVFKTVIPTKMLEFMACARPIVLGVEGQAKQILEEANAGISIEPENSQQLADAIVKLRSTPELRANLGQNGRDYVIKRMSRKRTAEEYISVMRTLISSRPSSR